MKTVAAALLLLPLATHAFVPPTPTAAPAKGCTVMAATKGASRKDALTAAGAGEHADRI